MDGFITNAVESKMKIGNKEFDVIDCEIEQRFLKFYVDNPRVYSALRDFDGDAPSQKEIEEHMIKMDHVKGLEQSIKQIGGLIDPLIVRDGDFAVLEGNSRLAAYRVLNKTNPIRWGKVKCKLLPSNIDDSSIASLLGTYHIVGRKDWTPFEQAGFLYRRMKESKKPIKDIADELGIAKGVATTYIKVFEYMKKHDDMTPSQWSYYEELLKNSGIQKEIKEHPETEGKIVEEIKSGIIEAAADIRKIGNVMKAKGKKANKVQENYRKGTMTAYQAYAEIKDSGGFDKISRDIKDFREYINGIDFEENVKESPVKNDILFDLKKIKQKIDNIFKDLNYK